MNFKVSFIKMNCLMICRTNRKLALAIRNYCAFGSAVQKQNDIFNSEKTRQRDEIGRIEKIEVTYEGIPESKKLLMNKGLSTPFHVANHIAEWLSRESALALVDEDLPWDMHRPLEDSCSLRLLRMCDDEPFLVNKAFWKFCSFLLGATICNSFAENVEVTLHSFPSPNISSGSFVYDASLSLPSWNPNSNELRVLSAEMVKLAAQELPLERLQVDEEVAKAIFSSNKFKLEQIPSIAAGSGGKITLYRMGSHIDISKGPLISNSSLLGRCSVTAVHQISSDSGPLFRFQGVALPKGIMLNHFAYKILEDRAMKLNQTVFSDQKVVEVA